MKLTLLPLLFATIANALPNGSPLCDTNGAASKMTAMGQNSQNLKDAVQFTSDKSTYQPNQEITISMKAKAGYNGILIYAVGNDPSKRVGKFEPLQGMKAAGGCSAFQLDDPNSVLTHSAPTQFSPDSQIKFTAPAQDVGPITIHCIIVDKQGATVKWGIFDSAVVINTTGNGALATSPDQNAAQAPPGCPPPVTVTVTAPATPIVKIRKCKPKNAQPQATQVAASSEFPPVATPVGKGGYPVATPVGKGSYQAQTQVAASSELPPVATPVGKGGYSQGNQDTSGIPVGKDQPMKSGY